MELTAEYLNSILAYDAETGVLRWTKSQRGFNRCGQIAGNREETATRVKIDGKVYLAHRVIWKMVHGEWPRIVH